MKINSATNYKISYGYNKRLNTKLKKRLEKEPDNKIYQAVAKINDTCNFTEDRIRELEKKDKSGIALNENLIEFYLEFFMDAKIALALIVERLFPDLKYFENEIDKYEEESFEDVDIKNASANPLEELRPAYFWRMALVDEANIALEARQTPKNTIYSIPETNETYKLKTKNDTKTDEGLIVKYKSNPDSPKSLDDVIGLDNCILDIKDLIIYPLNHPKEAQKRKEDYGIDIPSFSIFFGPPGCGKTMLAQAIQAQTGCDMYLLDISRVGSSYINETSNQIQNAYDYVKEQASKSDKPVILFMDEMDSMLTQRSASQSGNNEDNKMVNTLLPIIANAKHDNVLIIGATNMYNLIDPAVKRRADFEAYIGLPDSKDIEKLLKINLSKINAGKTLSKNNDEIKILSNKLKGYSPSHINKFIKSASMKAFREEREIQADDFIDVIKTSSIDKINEKEYLPESQKNAFKMGFNKE